MPGPSALHLLMNAGQPGGIILSFSDSVSLKWTLAGQPFRRMGFSKGQFCKTWGVTCKAYEELTINNKLPG